MPSFFSRLSAIALILTMFSLTSCGGSSSGFSTPPQNTRFIFAADNSLVYVYAQDPLTGRMTMIDRVTIGLNLRDVVIRASQDFLYVAGSNQIHQFSIAANGRLTHLGSDAGNSWAMATHPSGNYLYSVNTGNDIDMFLIEADGTLTSLGSLTFSTATNTVSLTVHPSGDYVYVTDLSGEFVVQLDVAGDGTLSEMATVSVPANPTGGADGPVSLSASPNGDFVYVNAISSHMILSYSVGADGSLTEVGTPLATGTSPQAVVISPDSQYVYVPASNGPNVSQYEIGVDGSLTALAPATVAVAGTPLTAMIDARGEKLYVSTISDGMVVFDVDGTGALTEDTASRFAASSINKNMALSYGASLNATPDFLYVSNGGTDNVITGYSVDGMGSLTALATPTVGISPDPRDIVVHPGGYAYAAVPGASGKVGQFLVDKTTGIMSAHTPTSIAALNDTRHVVLERAGRYLYATNYSANNVSQYSVGDDGTLTALANPTVATGIQPTDIVIHPDGHSAYVLNVNPGNVANEDKISQYDIDLDQNTVGVFGELVPMTTASIATGDSRTGLAIHPSGSYLYAANYDDDTISQYSIQANRELMAMTTATVATGDGPSSVAVHPNGSYVYVTNDVDGTIDQYDVDQLDGSLTLSAHAMTTATGTSPQRIAIDASASYLYVTNFTDETISQFEIATDGTLSANPTPTVATGTKPRRMTTVSSYE